jgi:hypothetical protein
MGNITANMSIGSFSALVYQSGVEVGRSGRAGEELGVGRALLEASAS